MGMPMVILTKMADWVDCRTETITTHSAKGKSEMANSPKDNRKGFSLIEVMLQLVVISVAVMPIMMTLVLQKTLAVQNQVLASNQIVSDQLFDNVLIQHPDPIDTYTVSTNTSVLCDPADRLMYTSATYPAACDVGGTTTNSPPFFQRSLSYSANLASIQVNVSLYKKSTSTVPYYTAGRVYRYDAYHIYFGRPTGSTLGDTTNADLINPTLTDFNTLIQPDNAGNKLWYPEASYWSGGGPPGANASNFNYYISYPATCHTEHIATSSAGLDYPYTQAVQLDNNSSNSGTCPNFTANFKVLPYTLYDVNLSFVVPMKSQTGSWPSRMNTGCWAAPHSSVLSCSVINLNNNTNGDASTTVMGGQYDIGLATSSNNNVTTADYSYVVHYQWIDFSTTGLNLLKITPQAMKPDTLTNYVYLSGIEVIPHGQQ
jgi:type II secretory pathway pseudopilin PulG